MGGTDSEGMRHRWMLPWLGLSLAAVLPYLNALDGQFIAGDLDFIVYNEALQPDRLLSQAFTNSYWDTGSGAAPAPYYRPLVVLLDGIDRMLHGDDPRGYHLTNLALHWAVVCLSAWLALSLGCSRMVAFTGAALFAVHPLHCHAVAYISGRTSVLACLAFVASMLCTLRAGRLAWRAGALGCFVMALLSKETGVMVPPVAFFMAATVLACKAQQPAAPAVWRDAADQTRWLAGARAAWRSRRGLWIGMALLLVSYLAVRYAVLGALGGTRAPLWHRLDGLSVALTLSKTCAFYLWKLLAPLQLSYLPPFVPALDPLDGLAWLSAAVLLSLTAWVFVPGKRRPGTGPDRTALGRFFVFWTLANLAPVSGLAPLEYFVKEHHAYLPAVGACFAFALGLEALASRLAPRTGLTVARRGMLASSLSLALLLAALTLAHNRHFASTRALCQRIVALEPAISEAAFAHPAMNRSAHRFATAHFELARLDLQKAACASALPHLERALVLARSDVLRADALYFSAGCLLKARPDLARARYEEVLALAPSRVGAAIHLAQLAAAAGRAADERRYLELACRGGKQAACQVLVQRHGVDADWVRALVRPPR